MKFEDNVKNSFTRLKEDMSNINVKISNLELQINEIKDILNHFFHMKQRSIQNENSHAHKNEEFKGFNRVNPESSIGNDGVHSSPLLRLFDASSSKQPTKKEDKSNNKDDFQIEKYEEHLNNILALTNSEFKIFAALYKLEKSLERSVTYADLSKELNMTIGGVRSYISDLLKNKKVPIIKYTSPNKDVFLSIYDEFKHSLFIESLINMRYKLDNKHITDDK